MYIEIVTPEKKVYEGDVNSVKVPGKKGAFQVLNDHAPIVSTLEAGMVSVVEPDGNEILFKAGGGVIELKKNKVIILVESID